MDALRDRLRREKIDLQQKPADGFLSQDRAQTLKNIEKKGSSLAAAASFIKKHSAHFESGREPLTYKLALDELRKTPPSSPDKTSRARSAYAKPIIQRPGHRLAAKLHVTDSSARHRQIARRVDGKPKRAARATNYQ